MRTKMTEMGVALQVAPPAFLYLGLAITASALFFPLFAYRSALSLPLIVIGSVWAAVGLSILLPCGVQVVAAFRKRQLITSGWFRIFLNPMYASYVLFLLPGLSLILDSWLVLTSSAAFFVLYRLFVGEEARYLAEIHGQRYAAYRAKVLFKFL